jgi:PGF-pre-PGF domain-containing protein
MKGESVPSDMSDPDADPADRGDGDALDASVDAPRGDVTREWELFVREETVLSMTFAAQPDEIAGSVSVSESNSPAVEDLSQSRTVHRAVDISVPESATETPATLQMVVESLPVADRENLEVMRYNESGETWEPLNTTVVSNRTWSTDRGASVLLLEADTPGFSTFAVTETGSGSAGDSTSADSGDVNETDPEDNERADISPHPDATTVWINDRRPYEPGTTVLIQEETVRAITFAADKESIRGIVAVNVGSPTEQLVERFEL